MTPEEARILRHEIRTPVNHLIGYSELLLEEDGIEPESSSQLHNLREAARAVLGLVPQILTDDGTLSGGSESLAQRAGQLQSLAAALRAGPGTLPTADVDRLVSAAARLAELAGRLSGGETAADPAPGALHADREGTAETILVVDDDEANRDVLGRRLQRLGYRVVEARDGVEALERLSQGGIDLVLLDVMMPRLDGYAVLERHHSEPSLRDVPVIMISALDQMDSIVRCIELGAEDYLPKPFDPVLLKARVSACLEKKRLHDSEKELLETVSRQADELRNWNTQLEARVAEKIEEIERLSGMARFVPPQVFEAVRSGGHQLLQSHRSEITVLFTDLRGWTPFTESAEPEDVMDVLASLHAEIGPLIFEHGGTITQFTGDGVMVVFNDPLPCEDPAWQAVQLATRMRERAETLLASWQRKGHELPMGMGIAMGFATCGQIGFEGHYEYTAIGTVTNVASRLCAAAGGRTFMSQRLQSLVKDRVRWESVGALELKGLRQPLETYALLGLS
jgi:class 3 adenylate cyclase/AmiR/NasT family two-component response regulator